MNMCCIIYINSTYLNYHTVDLFLRIPLSQNASKQKTRDPDSANPEVKIHLINTHKKLDPDTCSLLKSMAIYFA